jgi:hypothetical protein
MDSLADPNRYLRIAAGRFPLSLGIETIKEEPRPDPEDGAIGNVAGQESELARRQQ